MKKMGGVEQDAAFSELLYTSSSSINQILSLLNKPAGAQGIKVEWKDVITAAEQVSKHATTAGLLWSRDITKKDGMQNIQSFTEAIEGFLLLCHGSTVGAGPTLLKVVGIAAKQVVDASLNFLRGAITFSGKVTDGREINLPVLVEHIWETCEAVKKTPSTDCSAIVWSLTQVASSVKDVIRELHDFKQGDSSKDTWELDTSAKRHIDSEDAGLTEAETDVSSQDASEDLNEELSAEEMQVVQSAKEFISSFLTLLKKLIYLIADTANLSTTSIEDTVFLWERILELSQDLGVGVDEIGACLYLPQETETLRTKVAEMEVQIENLQSEIFALQGFVPEDVRFAIEVLKHAGCSLQKVLDSSGS